MVSIEKISYAGWQECYLLTNGLIELIIPAQIGIRIIHLGLVGQGNEFYVAPQTQGKINDPDWHLYGGHRLWHAPEAKPRTYYPDNQPIHIEQEGDVVRLIQTAEPTTGIQKEIELTLSSDAPHVRVVHWLRNQNLWALEMAPWALSVMKEGGVGILPLPPYGSHEKSLLPNRSLTLWSYTQMADPRWTWGDKYILLRQDTQGAGPQKLGMEVQEGWVGYANQGHLFIKTFTPLLHAPYPDRGSSVEMFTNKVMLEVETLAPLNRLEPNEAARHIEDWFLFDGVPTPTHEAEVDQHILPRAKDALALTAALE